MTNHSELDVPHWARKTVDWYRAAGKISEAVTDRMIYAKLTQLAGFVMSPDEICEKLRALEPIK